MAPGRKKGTNNKGKTSTELSLGDLVLAKVKGFPAWPAKISRPEEWERTPDPKKYFVQFFGTQEIAFVAPVDVQLFTIELKKKLQARSKGKTVKYFAQAVDEICEAFEEAAQKKSGALGDYEASNHNVSSALDGVAANGLEHDVEAEGLVVGNASAHGSSLERCSNMQEGSDNKKISSADEVEFSKEGKGKEDSSVCNERILSARTASVSPHSGDNHDIRDPSIALEASNHSKRLGGKQKIITEGNEVKGINVERKRKLDDAAHVDHVETSGQFKDGVLCHAFSSSNSKNEPSIENKKPDMHPQGFKLKKLMKDKKYCEPGHPKQKNSSQLFSDRDSVRITERSDQFKRNKHVESLDATKSSNLKNGKRDSSSLNTSDGKSDKTSEIKGSKNIKAEDHLHSKAQKSTMPSDVPGDEAVLSSVKRRRVTDTSDRNDPAFDNKRSSSSSFKKNDVTKKRRAIRLNDDGEDDVPKTPVHGSFAHKVNTSSSVPDSLQNNVQIQGNQSLIGHTMKGSSTSGEALEKQSVPSAKSYSQSTSAVGLLETLEKSEKVHPPSLPELDTHKQMHERTKMEFVSPKKASPHVVPASVKNLEEQSGNRHQDKVSASVALNKGQAMSVKGIKQGSEGSKYSQIQVNIKKSRQLSSVEKPKVAKKSQGQVDSAVSSGLEDFMKDRSNSLEDSKRDSEMSMKHLIAAAQAKRKQAQMENMISAFAAAGSMLPENSSPSAERQLLSGGSNSTLLDAQGIHSRLSSVSPGHASQIVLQNEGIEERDDEKPKLGHQGGSGSLSGGTEAAVARDAFEGMIETLSRTKESIGRATRLAVDCAKYGIANEVVDLLIRKLENEPSFHRKVDLFFLVDSITQCSHNQKGIAGASYIPAVQAALPRLLGAAAPAGASARENRRQCLKVLRLWLERKILPESVLRRYMDDIGASNDDINSGLSFRRPSRAERAVDDPIREMEGMLVDEYGSNVTFQLAGIFPSHGFDVDEEEEDVPNTSCMGVTAELAETATEMEACVVTPSDKHHHVLEDVDGELEMEDVDGELEMEDVSGHQKDEIALSTNGSTELDGHEWGIEGEKNSPTYDDAEALTPEGSPPLPLEPLPPLPPLPTSPPTPLPPSCPPSPPPPPPSPLVQSHLPSLLTSGPSAPVHPPPLPSQHSFPSQAFSQLPTSVPPSPQLSYQTPVPQDFCSMPSGTQIVQMPGNALQQSSCFIPAGMKGLQNPSGYGPSRSVEYGRSAHTAQPNQQFQPGHAAFSQGSFHPIPPPQIQTFANQFSYNKPAVQQHLKHPYPLSYSSPSLADNSTRFIADEHQTASGYYRPPPERPPSNNIGFQCSAPHSVQAGVPTLGHGNSHMLPPRPDMSAFTCWKPG